MLEAKFFFFLLPTVRGTYHAHFAFWGVPGDSVPTHRLFLAVNVVRVANNGPGVALVDGTVKLGAGASGSYLDR